jgi:fermentation-respiration switch protein FrsA (DUF1100 family)
MWWARAEAGGRGLVVVAWLAIVSGGCALHHPTLVSPNDPLEFERALLLYDRPVVVHCARLPELPPGTPLLLYATGDGGWRGKDRDLYRHMIRWGYPVAGFSAPDYLAHLGYVAGTTTPARLARDYIRLIEFAKESLDLPEATPTILVGVSRGAGLAVVAAGRREVQPLLAGVLAVALTKEEEYVRHYRTRRGHSEKTPSRELVTFDTYGSLNQLRSLPLAVIQSTRDGYLPADEARALFGPDTPSRRLRAVDARDHSFRGARDVLYDRMSAALSWICRVHSNVAE